MPIRDFSATPAPATSVAAETSFGQASAVGTSPNYARQDHTHGTPAQPSAATLSDYVTNVAAIALKFGGNSVGMTYSVQISNYTRIGNLVLLDVRLTLSAKGSSTGAATLTGLPVAASNTAGRAQGFVIPVYGATVTDYVLGQIDPSISTSAIQLYAINGGAAAALTEANFGNTSTVNFTCAYKAS